MPEGRGVVRATVPLSILFLCLLAPGLVSSSAQADRRIWRVRSGDALSVLAERFGVSLEQLRELNEITDDDRIVVGQELVIDGATAAGAAGLEAAPDAEASHEEPLAETPPHEGGPTTTVQAGETLSHVAVRMGTSVPALLGLNRGIDADRVRVGQELRVDTPSVPRVDYVVRRGDNLSRIASRHRVSVDDLRRWNRGLRPDRLNVGRVLRVYSDVPASTSESVGAPNRGRLVQGERLPPHPGYVIRDPRRAWGTLETILWMQDAFDAVRAAHSGAPRVRVHDISDENGGRMHGHRSHQSGRDVDVAYYQTRCGGSPCAFRRLNPDHLDVERQWVLFEHWLQNDRVEAIFMDYALQEPLYEEARRRGATRGQLRQWFQFPRGRTYPLGLVRHFPKHRDHLHVRFVCPDTDESCR